VSWPIKVRRPKHGLVTEVLDRFPVTGAFHEHRTPMAMSLLKVAKFPGQNRQVPPGEMPIDPLIDAGKLLRPRKREYRAPALLRLARLAALPMYDGLAEPQLSILGIERKG
jgi:hypothetical protein